MAVACPPDEGDWQFLANLSLEDKDESADESMDECSADDWDTLADEARYCRLQ